MNLSVVVPCYNEAEMINLFYEKFCNQISNLNIDYELIFVDDGSDDNTLSIIKNIANNDSHIKFISFSRNFGKEAAMLAGMQSAKGDYVGIMDADLQDPIEILVLMYKKIQNSDVDCIATRRNNRNGEKLFRSIPSMIFYKIVRNIFNINLVDGLRDFRLMKKNMVEAVINMPERNRFSKALFTWIGFKYDFIEFENVKRAAGETKWSMLQLFMYSIDGILSFSNMPMYWVIGLGFVFFIVSVLMLFFVLVRTLMYGDPVHGWPSLVCIIFFLSSIQLLCLGMMGCYITKIYTETKNRPLFIIREKN